MYVYVVIIVTVIIVTLVCRTGYKNLTPHIGLCTGSPRDGIQRHWMHFVYLETDNVSKTRFCELET